MATYHMEWVFLFFWKGKGNSSQATDFFLAGVFFSKRASLVNHQSLTFCTNFTNFKGYNSSWKRKLIKDDFSDQRLFHCFVCH